MVVDKYVSDNMIQREGKAVSKGSFAKKNYGISMNDRRYQHKSNFRLLLSLQNVYGNIFYTTVNSYHRHFDHQ